MPDRSSGLSKVKRFMPATGSVPIAAIIKPIIPAISPLTSDSLESEAMTDKPRMPSAK